MLTKETLQKAEKIAQDVAPVFEVLYKLGRNYDKTRNELRHAERVAHSWQFPRAVSDWEYIADNTHTKAEREQIRTLHENNPREWARILEEKYKAQHESETAHRVARINFINFINYSAQYLADLIRPIWRELVERRGLETLAGIINQRNRKKDHTAGACSVGLYLRDAEITKDKTTAGQYARIEINFYTGWACGIYGECSKIYQINPAEVWHFAEIPQKLTISQYKKDVAKVSQMVGDIERKAETLREFVRGCGLLGFVEIIKTTKEK